MCARNGVRGLWRQSGRLRTMRKMHKPSPAEFKADFDLMWNEPKKYIEFISERIRQSPADYSLYFDRAQAWNRVGDLDNALEDFGKTIALKDKMVARLNRGSLLMRMGRCQEALDDFNRAES